MIRRLCLVVLCAVAGSTAALSQGQREVAPTSGSSAIAGSVISADSSAQPLRRAVVTLTGGSLRPRSVVTDDAGKFVFTALPAGTYTVTAKKAAFLAAPYGARRPGRPGTSIALAVGQRADIAISMFRGAVLSGTLRDAAGVPVGGLDVRAIDARAVGVSDTRPAETTTTDDRGMFRFYGLLPGDYVVAAVPPGGGDIVAPGPPPARVGFAPIFYPGTPDWSDASRIGVGVGDEHSGLDFEFRHVHVASVEATVLGDTSDPARLMMGLLPASPRSATSFGVNSLVGRPIDARGRFQYSNIPPGRYRLIVRATLGTPPSQLNLPSAVAAPAGVSSMSDYLYGYTDVDVRGEDLSGITLTLTPGAVVTGRILVKPTGQQAPPDDLSRVRVTMVPESAGWSVSGGGMMNITIGNEAVAQSISTTQPDGAFEIRGIGPARFRLSVSLPADLARNWRARTAITGRRDLFDETLELVPGTKLGDVVVTLTDARTELSGTLSTGEGHAATDYYIVAMSTDRAMWRPRSRRVVSARPSTDGRFVFADLPPGDYLLAALTDLDPSDLNDQAFLAQLATAGVKVTMVEGDKTVQDLRIR